MSSEEEIRSEAFLAKQLQSFQLDKAPQEPRKEDWREDPPESSIATEDDEKHESFSKNRTPKTDEQSPQVKPEDDSMKVLLNSIAAAMAMMAQGQAKLNQAPFPKEYVPSFAGTDVTVFLERYEEVALHYSFTEQDKIQRLITYCQERQKQIIRYSNEYQQALKDSNWKTLREALRRKFRSNDSAQREEQPEFFDQWLRDCQSRSDLNIREYLEEFQIRVQRCIAAGTIEPEKKGWYLVKGLPFAQATRTLEKFGLTTMRYREFQFEKIQHYLSRRADVEEEARMLNPAEATRRLDPVHAFQPHLIEPRATSSPAQVFQPPTLSETVLPSYTRAKHQSSPPGVPPTQQEVDLLTEKLSQMKVNKVNFINVQWSPRESELLANQAVAIYAQKASDERLSQSQTQYTLNTQRTYTSQYPKQNQREQQGAGLPPRPSFACFVCDKLGHGKFECPTINQLIEREWCHWNEARQLVWGTLTHPQGRVANLGTKGWAETLLAHIKRVWLKRDANPLTTKADWDALQPRPIENNSVTASFTPDHHSGAISAEDYQAFWEASEQATKDDDLQCFSTSVAAATIKKEAPKHKSIDRKVIGTPKVLKPVRPTQPTIEKRIEEREAIQPRGHQRKDPSPTYQIQLPAQVPQQPVVDQEMMDAALRRTFKPTESKQPKKARFADQLPSTTDEVIQAIMSAPVSMPIGSLISNMSEVKKKLFRNTYTREEFQLMQVNAVSESDSEEEEIERPTLGPVVASLDANVPDYVLVEAPRGQVTQCFSMSAAHWSDPEVSQVQQRIEQATDSYPQDPVDSEMYTRTASRREYDRQAGIEHIRRDCPKVPVSIAGSHFLSLLDSGAELNTIRRESADAAMLPIATLPREMRKARMVTANGTHEGFVGIVWGVSVTVGSITVRTNFFVVDNCTNAVILGNPFLADARARIEYAASGLTYCRIWSEEGDNSTRFVCTKGNQVNARGVAFEPLGKEIGM
jgi:hypothetical protein